MATTILVVDDDRDVHRLLAPVMAAKEWQMESSFNGEDGWKRAQEHAYDIVLTGVQMPGMDGMELLRRIRGLHPGSKVMVITAETTPDRVIRALREQAFTFLSKPFSATTIAEMIEQALSSPVGKDDIEVLSARPEWISLRMRCKMENVDRLTQFLREAEMGLAAEEREQIGMAFRELLLNAIEHGGRSNPSKKIYVSYVQTAVATVYYIRDPGPGFSMGELPHAAVSNPPDDNTNHMEVREEQGMRPGGFGIFLAKKLADEIIYNEKGNEVLLLKYRTSGR